MLAHRGIAEIPKKRFSHKRAYVWNGVRVEIFLAQPGPPDTTVMFDGPVRSVTGLFTRSRKVQLQACPSLAFQL